MKAFIEGICGTHGDRVCLVAAAIVREDGKYVEFGVRKHFGVLKMLKEARLSVMRLPMGGVQELNVYGFRQ